jgi:serine acetyltransferase
MTVTFRQTIKEMQADYRRRTLLENRYCLISKALLLFKRGMVAVFLYRLARYCALHEHQALKLILLKLSNAYSKHEISPLAKIGPGLVLADQGGIGINHVAVIGENCTFFGCSTLTLGVMDSLMDAQKDIIIGDHCVIGHRVKIMRAISLANCTQIQANAVVIRGSSQAGAMIQGIPAKTISVELCLDVIRWNPLSSAYIDYTR